MILVKGRQRYQRSKLEFAKNICRAARFEPVCPGSAKLADIFSELQLWPLVSLQPLDPQYLFRKIKTLQSNTNSVQESSSTFKTFYLQSKYPYFNGAYVLSSGFGCPYLYICITGSCTFGNQWKCFRMSRFTQLCCWEMSVDICEAIMTWDKFEVINKLKNSQSIINSLMYCKWP